MSMIHSSCAELGCRSSLSAGTARYRTVRSMEMSMQGSARTASPIHSRRPASAGTVEDIDRQAKVEPLGVPSAVGPADAVRRSGVMRPCTSLRRGGASSPRAREQRYRPPGRGGGRSPTPRRMRTPRPESRRRTRPERIQRRRGDGSRRRRASAPDRRDGREERLAQGRPAGAAVRALARARIADAPAAARGPARRERRHVRVVTAVRRLAGRSPTGRGTSRGGAGRPPSGDVARAADAGRCSPTATPAGSPARARARSGLVPARPARWSRVRLVVRIRTLIRPRAATGPDEPRRAPSYSKSRGRRCSASGRLRSRPAFVVGGYAAFRGTFRLAASTCSSLGPPRSSARNASSTARGGLRCHARPWSAARGSAPPQCAHGQ